MGKRYIIIAGEEGGPASNKLGGIWNVISSETETLATMIAKGEIDKEISVLVAGPYYPHSGTDWNKAMDRVTTLEGVEPITDNELKKALKTLERMNIKTHAGVRKFESDDGAIDAEYTYVLFETNNFDDINGEFMGKPMTLSECIKGEAWSFYGLDSTKFEKEEYGRAYTHFLNLSYSISELARILAGENSAMDGEDGLLKFPAVPVEAKGGNKGHEIPNRRVSIHCHEYWVFYVAARLKKLLSSVKTVATFHATIPGRAWGYNTLEKIKSGDATIDPKARIGLTKLEEFARYADKVTFVGESTRREATLFYGIDGVVVRNGIRFKHEDVDIDWDVKTETRERVQQIIARKLKLAYNVNVKPHNIIPIYTISRLELENKGYPDLLDSLKILDRIVRHHILTGTIEKDVIVMCFMITAHGAKDPEKLPESFPFEYPDELLGEGELKLREMIRERGLMPNDELMHLHDPSNPHQRRVFAVDYSQWLNKNDKGFNMAPNEFFRGCVASIFPSRYEPFLLTALESAKEATPFIISSICGLSDAITKLKRKVLRMGDFLIVDNIHLPRDEMLVDYALSLEYFIHTSLTDKIKYNLLCSEAFELAKDMNWKEPVKQYYEMLK